MVAEEVEAVDHPQLLKHRVHKHSDRVDQRSNPVDKTLHRL
jgi:hypothetical protein